MKRALFKKIAIYGIAGLFIIMVLSLGITYALGAGQMRISGQAYFVPQPDVESELLPIYPIDPNGDGNYIIVTGIGGATVYVIQQEYIEGNLHLSICSNNSNNGNTAFNMTFQFANPTVYPWTRGSVTFVSPTPASEGGIPNTGNFTFSAPALTPTALTTGQIATITLPVRAQLGRPDAGGSATVTVQYDVDFGGEYGVLTKSNRVFFTYVPRQSSECPL